MSFPEPQLKQARRHLRRSDPVMRSLIDAVGPPVLKLRPQRFQMLVRSIIAQQISTMAARSIRRRFDQLVGPGTTTAEKVARLSPQQMRTAGISPQKATYLLDLSAKVLDGTVRLRTVGRMTDDEVIAELVQVKGIGVWTSQMFLMFCLGRPDVFPHGDLGIRNAMKILYRLEELPDRTTSEELSAPWRPHATIASWYLWRSHDLKTGAADGPDIFPC
jgi:DNA-3-methyladenine glycosylase II